jgi:hypothetical protein
MQTEYIYPNVGNRMSPKEWNEAGKPLLLDTAIARKNAILAQGGQYASTRNGRGDPRRNSTSTSSEGGHDPRKLAAILHQWGNGSIRSGSATGWGWKTPRPRRSWPRSPWARRRMPTGRWRRRGRPLTAGPGPVAERIALLERVLEVYNAAMRICRGDAT